ncbi:MAG: DNA mismatch endonuclease Vsr [Ruminococcaceae bacterium]|nr:DNA mismatch endonuclease Vsr [Oscillospiraceae bacterium]
MADRLSVKDRSELMAKIKNKNTSIEIRVRKWMFSRGFRYRINVKKLPGSPDIVPNKYKCAIFLNGCFWHGHNCPDGHLPKSNIEFWKNKINRNIERPAN